jgi:drug/metabolite transporter (DMT)-like permease
MVFAAVLLAALMHASWNALVKVQTDRLSAVLLIVLAQVGISLVLLPFFPLPLPASCPWVLASGIVHTGYKLTLIQAYRHGDFSQVYPIARGTAPLLVAIVSIAFLSERITVEKCAAIALIGFGVCCMSLRRASIKLPKKALLPAVTTAAFTASYTLVDGLGVRQAGSATSFLLWTNILDGAFTCTYAILVRGSNAFINLRPAWRAGLPAGAMSLLAYWIVIWAFTQAPIAIVAALRETSVLFAVVIATLFLKERIGLMTILAAMMIATGVVLMRL